MTLKLARENINKITGFLGLTMQELANKVRVLRGFLLEVRAEQEKITEDLNDEICRVLFESISSYTEENKVNKYRKLEITSLSKRICEIYIQAFSTDQVLYYDFLNNIFDKSNSGRFCRSPYIALESINSIIKRN